MRYTRLGGAEGAIDASNILKPSLARGELQLIGATTIVEYRKYIEKDAALERRFQPVTVEEPTKEQCLDILRGLKKKYEDHTQYADAPVYLLCHGAYVASDFDIVHAYPDKKYMWGYFPAVNTYNLDNLFLFL